MAFGFVDTIIVVEYHYHVGGGNLMQWEVVGKLHVSVDFIIFK